MTFAMFKAQVSCQLLNMELFENMLQTPIYILVSCRQPQLTTTMERKLLTQTLTVDNSSTLSWSKKRNPCPYFSRLPFLVLFVDFLEMTICLLFILLRT